MPPIHPATLGLSKRSALRASNLARASAAAPHLSNLARLAGRTRVWPLWFPGICVGTLPLALCQPAEKLAHFLDGIVGALLNQTTLVKDGNEFV